MNSIKNILIGTALVGITGVAQAVPTLYVSTTGAPGTYIAVASNPSGTVNGFFAIGSWNVNIVTGLTYPALGTAATPAMSLSIQSSTTAAGSIYIGFASDGFTGLGSINATLTGQVASPDSGTGTYAFTTFADISNVQPGGTLPTGLNITYLSGSLPANVGASGNLPLTSPYVLGELVQITATGTSITANNPQSFSINANLGFTPAGVPDGGVTVAMLGFGLVALVCAQRRLAKA